MKFLCEGEPLTILSQVGKLRVTLALYVAAARLGSQQRHRPAARGKIHHPGTKLRRSPDLHESRLVHSRDVVDDSAGFDWRGFRGSGRSEGILNGRGMHRAERDAAEHGCVTCPALRGAAKRHLAAPFSRCLSARWPITLAHAREQYTASARRKRNSLPQSGRAQYRAGGIGWPQCGHVSVGRFTHLEYHRDTVVTG